MISIPSTPTYHSMRSQGSSLTIDEMLDEEKSKQLISEIEQAEGITEEERRFLIQAARRHNVLITGISQSIMHTPHRRCRD